MSNRLDIKLNNSGHVIEQISPYLDGALDDAASDAVQAHIAGCSQCRAEYVEVRATRQLLRDAVTLPPPRAFTLTEEMVGRKRWSWGRLLVPRNVPRLLSGSAAVFALVAILFVLDLSNVSNGQNDLFTASAPLPVMKQAATSSPGNLGYVVGDPTHVGFDSGRASGAGVEGTPGILLPAVPMPTTMTENSALAQTTTTAAMSANMGDTSKGTASPVEPASGGTDMQSQAPPNSDTPRALDALVSPTAAGYTRASENNTSAPDGGRLLLFSFEGLLVTLGAVLALGAVFAARR